MATARFGPESTVAVVMCIYFEAVLLACGRLGELVTTHVSLRSTTSCSKDVDFEAVHMETQ